MSSWEDIANEIAPIGARPNGLAVGAHRRPSEGARVAAPYNPQIVASPYSDHYTPLDAVLQGKNREGRFGDFYHVARAATEFDQSYFDLSVFLGQAVDFIGEKTNFLCSADDLLFVDIETTGLSSSTALFLIGALHNGDRYGSGALLELFLARSVREERAAIAEFLDLVSGKVLVTFNGKRFDWPFIEGRALRHGLRVPPLAGHFDLLHHARSQWKALVPNCRLQTLEYYLCSRKREGDVASSKIPSQYRQFAEIYELTGRGTPLMVPIVHHNTWDVLTMADLLRRFDQTR